jgi:hypothetical protein
MTVVEGKKEEAIWNLGHEGSYLYDISKANMPLWF